MTRKPGSMLYTPPEGYYDLPFSWLYDASALTDGLTYPNQYLYLQGGYGDFILRRIVGLNRVLNPATGQYQIRDNSNNYIQSVPVYGAAADDIAVAPELRYQETGAIKFDLGIIDLPSIPQSGQIVFQGVRRMKGNPAANPTYKSRPKTFTYILPASVSAPIGSVQTFRQLVSNYDFELYQLIILGAASANASASFGDDESIILITAVNPGATGDSIVIELDSGGPFPANQPESVSVVGTTIKYIPATDGFGDVIYNPPSQGTNLQLLNALAANPQSAALITASLDSGLLTQSGFGKIPSPGNLSGGSLDPLGPAVNGAALTLYDSNKVAISSEAVPTQFMDGGPQSTYKNGAIVPPLWYPKDSQIQVDVKSLLAKGSGVLQILLVGRQHIPC